LLSAVLVHLPNLVEVRYKSDVRRNELVDTLASHHGPRFLSLGIQASSFQHSEYLDPKPLSQLLRSFCNLESLELSHVTEGPPSCLPQTLAAMPQLKSLSLSDVKGIDSSWAVSFASGGLSVLSLLQCDIPMTNLGAILAMHANSLDRIRLGFADDALDGEEWASGPSFGPKKLKSLSIGIYDAQKRFIRRFSGSLLEPLYITTTGPDIAATSRTLARINEDSAFSHLKTLSLYIDPDAYETPGVGDHSKLKNLCRSKGRSDSSRRHLAYIGELTFGRDWTQKSILTTTSDDAKTEPPSDEANFAYCVGNFYSFPVIIGHEVGTSMSRTQSSDAVFGTPLLFLRFLYVATYALVCN
jgi:hypothetical protein